VGIFRLNCRLLTALALLPLASAASGQPKATADQADAPLPRVRFIADMDREFRRIDADRNGQLSGGEIERHQQLQALAAAEARNRRLFDELDADRNGQLSPAEFARMVGPPLPVSAQPMLARMDGNRDRQISLAEHRAATLANFDRLDSNRDQLVTPAEMKAGGIAPR